MNKKNFAILTSGGDSPGMNCAIRSFVRSCIYHDCHAFGIYGGYQGLIEGNIKPLDIASVGNILQRGGTILQSSRSEEFKTQDGRAKAFSHLKSLKIDGLVVIGGDGSFKGASALSKDFDYPVVGIPGTIDNDISNTDYTIGHNTAVQTAIEAVDKIRDTAFSHDRVFLIEVMGRRSASLACKVALATGAEDVILPNKEIDFRSITECIESGIKRGKKGSIFIVAEGKLEGSRAYDIQSYLLKTKNIQSRVCILGHIQRGGSPSTKDRIIASQMGNRSVELLLVGKKSSAVIVEKGVVNSCDLKQCLEKENEKDLGLRELIKVLAI